MTKTNATEKLHRLAEDNAAAFGPQGFARTEWEGLLGLLGDPSLPQWADVLEMAESLRDGGRVFSLACLLSLDAE